MNYIWDGFIKAIELLIGFDKEIYEIIGLSLFVSTTATLIASFIFAPLGCYFGIFGIKEFKYKRGFSRLVYNFMSIPSVIVGLVVALLFTRNGPLGFFWHNVHSKSHDIGTVTSSGAIDIWAYI